MIQKQRLLFGFSAVVVATSTAAAALVACVGDAPSAGTADAGVDSVATGTDSSGGGGMDSRGETDSQGTTDGTTPSDANLVDVAVATDAGVDALSDAGGEAAADAGADCGPLAMCGVCTNLLNDPLHCGGCAIACSTNNVPAPACAASVCTGACAAGFADCNSNKQTDGCEVNTTGDPDRCGGCTRSCSSTNVTTRACTGGTCTGACAAGFADCNGNKLTDGCETNLANSSTNCGACGYDCLGGACVAQKCQPVRIATTSGAGSPHLMAADEQNVYWGTSTAVMQSTVSVGGTPIQLGAATSATSMVPVGATLYWVDQLASTYLTRRATVGSASSAVTITTSANAAHGLAYDPNTPTLFVLRAPSGTSSQFNITNCALNGPCTDIQGGGGMTGVPSQNLVVAGTDVVWADTMNNTISKMAVVGSLVSNIATGQNGPYIVATDGTNFYWVRSDATIYRSASPVPTLLVSTGSSADGLLVDATYVYWAAYNGVSGTNVYAIPKGGGATITLATGVEARWLAMNSSALFWAESTQIMKVRKP